MPPNQDKELEKKADAFINAVGLPLDKKNLSQDRPKKEKVKPVYLRAPESLYDDIQEIIALTGLTMNAVCLELLRPAIKNKLKELREI